MPYPLVGSLLNPITFWVRAALANLPLAGLAITWQQWLDVAVLSEAALPHSANPSRLPTGSLFSSLSLHSTLPSTLYPLPSTLSLTALRFLHLGWRSTPGRIRPAGRRAGPL